MKTCMTPVTSAIFVAVNATPLHVERSCVHLKNLMAPNNSRHDQNRVTCSISGNRKSVARAQKTYQYIYRMHIRQKKTDSLSYEMGNRFNHKYQGRAPSCNATTARGFNMVVLLINPNKAYSTGTVTSSALAYNPKNMTTTLPHN